MRHMAPDTPNARRAPARLPHERARRSPVDEHLADPVDVGAATGHRSGSPWRARRTAERFWPRPPGSPVCYGSPAVMVAAALRLSLAVLLAVSLHARPTSSSDVERTRRVGWLAQVPRSAVPTSAAARLVRRAAELGWIEGRHVVFEYRHFVTVDDADRHAMELVRLGVDLVIAQGSPAIVAARKATVTIPIVMVYAGDVVDMGIAEPARAGGNVTGVGVRTGVDGARAALELVRQVLPRATRVGVLWEPGRDRQPPLPRSRRWLESAAAALGVQLVHAAPETRDELHDAFRGLEDGRAEALLVGSGPFAVEHRHVIMKLARRHRLPTFVDDERPIEGALVAFAAETRHIPARAAEYVDRILRGARPRDLPVDRPTEWRIIVDLRTARALGVTVPRAVLARAERVVE